MGGSTLGNVTLEPPDGIQLVKKTFVCGSTVSTSTAKLLSIVSSCFPVRCWSLQYMGTH